MDKHHLLYWVFKAIYVRDGRRLTQEDFERIKPPSWVWPAYEQKMREFYRGRHENADQEDQSGHA